jgi:hypothetical protein
MRANDAPPLQGLGGTFTIPYFNATAIRFCMSAYGISAGGGSISAGAGVQNCLKYPSRARSAPSLLLRSRLPVVLRVKHGRLPRETNSARSSSLPAVNLSPTLAYAPTGRTAPASDSSAARTTSPVREVSRPGVLEPLHRCPLYQTNWGAADRDVACPDEPSSRLARNAPAACPRTIRSF